MRLSVLRFPDYRRYFVSSVCAVNAMWMLRIVLGWMAWEETGDAAFVGIVAGVSLAPVTLVGPFFGVLVDRSEILRAFRAVNFLFLCLTSLLLALLLLGLLTPAMILLLSAGFGIGVAIHHPIRQSLAPRLVDRYSIGPVVALSALNFNVARMASPAAAGLMIAHLGPAAATFAGLLLLLPNQVVGFFIHPRESASAASGSRLLEDFREGLRTVAFDPVNRGAVFLVVVAMGPVRGLLEVLSLIADGKFGLGAEGFGLLASAVGGGALLAALVQIILPERPARGKAFAVIVGYLSAFALVATSSFPVAVAATAVAGYSGTFVAIALQVEIQSGLDDALRGRVMSLWMLAATAAVAVCSVVIGGFSKAHGLEATTIALLAVCAVCSIPCLIPRRRGWPRP